MRRVGRVLRGFSGVGGDGMVRRLDFMEGGFLCRDVSEVRGILHFVANFDMYLKMVGVVETVDL